MNKWINSAISSVTVIAACGLVLAGCGSSSVPGEPTAGGVSASDPVNGSSGRSTVSFDEGWTFFLGDEPSASDPEFDDSAWRQLDVPHDWQIEDLPNATSDDAAATAIPDIAAHVSHPEIFATAPRQIGPFTANQDQTPLFGGRSQGWTLPGRVGWYRKRFELPNLPNGRKVELRFDGIMQQAEIWLNGELIETSTMGYLPVYMDITPHLVQGGENVVAVRVENAVQSSRWYNGSGIYRHTWLTFTNELRLPTDTIYITTPEITARRSSVRVEAQVETLGEGTRQAAVRVTVFGPTGQSLAVQDVPDKDVDVDAPATFVADLAVSNPALWSPDSPSLYEARVDVLQAGSVIDSVTTTFGIRTIETDPDRGLLLNGEPIQIRGANVHHDHGPLGAVALYRSEERRMEILKAGGFNAIRTGHMPPTAEQLEICDRLGLLYYNEIYDAWDAPKGGANNNPNFITEWPEQVDRWVRRDRNHPSIFVWGIGNEIFVDPVTRGAEIAAAVRELDDTRLIARGGFYDDASFEYTDVGDEHYSTDNSDVREAHPDIIIMQSESYPSLIYADWAFENAHGWAFGNFVWHGWDHIGESGLGTTLVEETNPGINPEPVGLSGVFTYPWYLSYSGDFDLIGQQKPQNYWRQVIYGLSPIEMLVERPLPLGLQQAAQGWAYYDELESWTWDVTPGQLMRVRVYTSGDSVELFLNGASLGTEPLVESDEMRVTFDVPFVEGELVAVASRNGIEIGRKTLTTVGPPAAVRLTSDVPQLTTGRDDLAHVLVEVVDAQGRLVPDAVAQVFVDVEGAGTLMGMASGNPHNVDSFQKPRRHTFHGKALAVVRPAKSPGTVQISATADGLMSAELALPVVAE